VDERMTIGEFSSRTGLSAKVLRNYADQGVLVPSAVDPASGYRYYDTHQLDDAVIVALLRRAGIPVADIRRFLAHPVAEAVDGWERSLVAEVNARRQALSEARGRMGLSASPTRGATMVEIRPVDDREELRQVFDLVGGELSPRIDTTDFRFR
jgi:DNA-binding transcriptional MerR regulator